MKNYHYFDPASDTNVTISLDYGIHDESLCDKDFPMNSLSLNSAISSYGACVDNEDFFENMICYKPALFFHRDIDIEETKKSCAEHGLYPIFYEAVGTICVGVEPIDIKRMDSGFLSVKDIGGIIFLTRAEVAAEVFKGDISAKNIDFSSLSSTQEAALLEYGQQRVNDIDLCLNGVVPVLNITGTIYGNDVTFPDNTWQKFGVFETAHTAMPLIVETLDNYWNSENGMPEQLKQHLLAEWSLDGNDIEITEAQPHVELDIAGALKNGVNMLDFEKMLVLVKNVAEGVPSALAAQEIVSSINRDLFNIQQKGDCVER